jgi:hypothetical protein
MEINTEKYADMWIEDDILYITYTFEDYTEQMVDAGIKQRYELTKDKSYPMYADIRKVKSFTRDARQRMAQKDAGAGTKAVAIMTNSRVQEVIYNFFNTIYKAPAPAKMFSNKEKAIEWLQQFK